MREYKVNKLEESLLAICVDRHLTLALAESCTGGALAARLTKIPGASQYFAGAIVSYQNQAKMDLLKVPKQMLEQYGAVSEAVAKQMLIGTLMQFRADIGIAITGIAGPSGDTSKTPIGTIYIALGRKNAASEIIHLQLEGTREWIIEKTVEESLLALIRYLA